MLVIEDNCKVCGTRIMVILGGRKKKVEPSYLCEKCKAAEKLASSPSPATREEVR
jgi:hypothetical protein